MRDPMPFLLARLAEDDVVMWDLVDCIRGRPLLTERPQESGLVVLDRSDRAPVPESFRMMSAEESEGFRERYDPWRLAYDIESRLRIAEEHRPTDQGTCSSCTDGQSDPPIAAAYPCRTLRFLTWVYSHHPNYDREWDDE